MNSLFPGNHRDGDLETDNVAEARRHFCVLWRGGDARGHRGICQTSPADREGTRMFALVCLVHK